MIGPDGAGDGREGRHDAPEPAHPAEIVLLDYLQGDLPGKDLDEVHRHVVRCRDCRRTLTELVAAVEEIEHLPTARILPPTSSPVRMRRPVPAPHGSHLKGRVVAIAGLLLAAAAVWAAAQGVGETPGNAAAPHRIAALAPLLAPLGARIVVDETDPEHAIVLAVPGSEDAVRETLAGRTGSLRVELASLAPGADAQAR